MVVAAAIKFKILKTGEEVVLCGCRHDDIFTQLKALGFKPHEGYEEIEQGFIDNRNNFISREKAYNEAKLCGQLYIKVELKKEQNNDHILYSEDLW